MSKIRYIKLNATMPLPGFKGKQFFVTDQPGTYFDKVNGVEPTDKGFLIVVNHGPHKGRYELMDHLVEVVAYFDEPKSSEMAASVQPQRNTQATPA